MAEKNGVYKCSVCGNVVSVIEAHQGELVCCGKPMEFLPEQTYLQEGREKHVPLVEVKGNQVTVRVGSTAHPMLDNHYLEFIQLIQGERILETKRLYPGEAPEVSFTVKDARKLRARVLCNVHGLWTS
ncbi:MAG: desulfoferrodoxin [Candidatus Micrarchaeia archaeon]